MPWSFDGSTPTFDSGLATVDGFSGIVLSARERLLAYVATTLSSVTGVTTYRSREAPVAREEGLVVILRPEEEAVSKLANGLTIRDLTVSVTLIVRSAIPDSTADQLLAKIHAAIMADTTLAGNAARCIELSTRWNFELADQTALAAEVRYQIKYLTPTDSFGAIA